VHPVQQHIKVHHLSLNVLAKISLGKIKSSRGTLKQLQDAIKVLIGGTSLLQTEEGVSGAINNVFQSLPSGHGLRPRLVPLLAKLVQIHSSTTRYAPQSITIQGILTEMYAEFARDLMSLTKDEALANTNFEDLLAAKKADLKRLRKLKADKEKQRAEADTQLADTTENFDGTTVQMKADIHFFDQTKEACEAKHAAWEVRRSLRTEELKGIDAALAILTTDAARELFHKAIQPGKEVRTEEKYSGAGDISFLQESSSANFQSALSVLLLHAEQGRSLRLARLIVSLRATKSGHFDKVIAAIDKMIQLLKDEEQADITKRDQCKEKNQQIASTVADLTWKISVNQAKIDKLEKLIEMRTKEKKDTIEEMNRVSQQIKDMTKQREKEHAEFKQAKADDLEAIDLLKQARAALAKYYEKNKIDLGPIQGDIKGVALLQDEPEFEVSKDQAPEAVFSGKGSRKTESKGILSLMTSLVEDLNDEIKNAQKDEENAQLEFEEAKADAEDLFNKLDERKTTLTGIIARRDNEKIAEETDQGENEKDKRFQLKYKADIKPDCDWIISSFEERAVKRNAEMDGLVQAREYLAGANSPSFAQQKAVVMDHRFLGRA